VVDSGTELIITIKKDYIDIETLEEIQQKELTSTSEQHRQLTFPLE
jgi:hypothetical protein